MHRPLVAACLVAFLATGCSRLAEHPLVVEAVDEVRQNARVAALLGTPVTCSRSVSGLANETDGIAALRFEARGPKSTGVVVVEGKKTQNRWGVTMLELRPADGAASVDLSGDLVARTGTDTPAFDPTAAPAQPSQAPPPPGEIEIALPPGPPGQ
jgi:hypothetical protein